MKCEWNTEQVQVPVQVELSKQILERKQSG